MLRLDWCRARQWYGCLHCGTSDAGEVLLVFDISGNWPQNFLVLVWDLYDDCRDVT